VNLSLRVFLWSIAVAVVMMTVATANALLDKLPIWFGPGPHFWIESSVFWFVVGPAIWRWLARRVWVVPASELPSHHSAPQGE
jgi:hypothetical protein